MSTEQPSAIDQARLEMALRHLRRPGWPESVEAALADPIHGPLVRMLAARMGRPSWRTAPTGHGQAQQPQGQPSRGPAVPTSTPLPIQAPRPLVTPASAPPLQRRDPPPGRSPLPRLTHDPRRLAANDHD